MTKSKKSSSPRISILAICAAALIIFAALSLYAMATRHTEPAGEAAPAVTGADAARKEKFQPSKISPPPLKPVSVIPARLRKEAQQAKPHSAAIIPVNSPESVSASPPVLTAESKSEFNIQNSPPQVVIPSTFQHHRNTSGATLHAVTYASHGGKDDRFCRAIESAVRHEVDLIILGWGVKWRGLSQKLEAALSFAEGLPSDDIILFTDAFDVMFTNNPKHIRETYDELSSKGSEILFAGECGCWPHVTIDHGRPCFEKYPKSPTPYRYLNSGTWIGKAAPSAKMLAAVQKEAGKDFANANDQELVANMFMEGRFGIALDYHAKLFQSMHLTLDKPLPRCKPIEDIQVVGQGQLFNKRTNTFPAVFHFNGGGKRHHLEMEGKLWYKKSEFNTAKELEHLRSHRIRVPIASNKDRTLPFEDICPAYFGPKSTVDQRERFHRKERKTNRGRSITMTRNREY